MFDNCLVDLLFACVVLLTSCSCRQPFIAGIFLLGSGRSIAAGKEGMVHVGRKCGVGTCTKPWVESPDGSFPGEVLGDEPLFWLARRCSNDNLPKRQAILGLTHTQAPIYPNSNLYIESTWLYVYMFFPHNSFLRGLCLQVHWPKDHPSFCIQNPCSLIG